MIVGCLQERTSAPGTFSALGGLRVHHGPKRTRGPATRLLTVLQLREHIVGILSADGKGDLRSSRQ